MTLSLATLEARAHQHLADPLVSAPFLPKVVPPEASHLDPPSNDAGGAAPPSSDPLPDGATPDATADSDDESNEGNEAAPIRGRPKLQTARINRDALLLFCNNASAPPSRRKMLRYP